MLTGADRPHSQAAGPAQQHPRACNPNDIGAALGVKERLGLLVAKCEPSRIHWRLADFHDASDAAMPESTQLDGYSQLTVVACLVNGFTPRVGRRSAGGYGPGSGRGCGSPGRSS